MGLICMSSVLSAPPAGEEVRPFTQTRMYLFKLSTQKLGKAHCKMRGGAGRMVWVREHAPEGNATFADTQARINKLYTVMLSVNFVHLMISATKRFISSWGCGSFPVKKGFRPPKQQQQQLKCNEGFIRHVPSASKKSINRKLSLCGLRKQSPLANLQ